MADGRTIVSIVLSDDGKNCLEGAWFNQPYITRRHRYGQRLAFSGKPKWFRDHWQMSSPRVQILDSKNEEETPGIVPVYPLTEDLRPEQLRPLIRRAVDQFANQLVEILPADLPPAAQASPISGRRCTRSISQRPWPPPRRRGGGSSTKSFSCCNSLSACAAETCAIASRHLSCAVTPAIDARIRRLFPFTPTGDQNQAIAEVCRDLAGDRPMQRLLQADVGAGKTAVAVYAMLVAVANKHQAALMAPTEVLARQHWRTLESYLAQSRVQRLLLTGACPPASAGKPSPPLAKAASTWSSAPRRSSRKMCTSPGSAWWWLMNSTSSASISGHGSAVSVSIPITWS